jgi:hypothetical protein
MTPDEYEDARETLRLAILSALDKWAREQFGDLAFVQSSRTPGATDGDLSHLFPAIDAHFARLLDRFGVTVDAE